MKNTKKKGFTLIELIAVIAILAILGAVLVPRVAGYQLKARKANVQSSAKTIVNAIQAYNADKTSDAADPQNVASNERILDDTIVTNAVDALNAETVNNTIITTSGDAWDSLENITVAELVAVANNEFTIDKDGVVTVTSPGSIE